MQILETREYEMFEKLPCNRQLHEGNIKKIQKSIAEENLLKERPILVDENLCVIDGQHRLEAARRMGISIWYQITEKNNLKNLILYNNNNKSWGIEDYLNFYSHQDGYESYKELDKFITKHMIDANIALHILSSDRSTGFYKDFKEGRYQFPEGEKYLEAVKKKEMIDETVAYIKKKTSGNKVYLDRVTFYGALVTFFSSENFFYETFFKKLEYKLDLMRPCSKREEYLRIFKDIYNWKNHSRI